MNAYEFMARCPITTAILALVLGLLIEGAIKNACVICVRTIRHMNIRRHGWPPAHLDADGDWKPEPKPNREVDQ